MLIQGMFFLMLLNFSAQANDVIWDTKNARLMNLDQFASECSAGQIIVFGEQHGTSENQTEPDVVRHHDNQAKLLNLFTANGKPTHVTTGMEFFTYTSQASVDQFVAGLLGEADFLKQIQWGKNPFSLYRRQVLIPKQSGGRTVALNIPQSIASHVAKGGPAQLTEEERALLPPIWERGQQNYMDRFRELMSGGHITEAQMENFFWAQSLWDDTMAWNTLKNLESDAKALTVIIVGEFHVEFNQGLPARLARHGAKQVKTLLQVESPDLSSDTINRLAHPDLRYGDLADFLWVLQPQKRLSQEQPRRDKQKEFRQHFLAAITECNRATNLDDSECKNAP